MNDIGPPLRGPEGGAPVPEHVNNGGTSQGQVLI